MEDQQARGGDESMGESRGREGIGRERRGGTRKQGHGMKAQHVWQFMVSSRAVPIVRHVFFAVGFGRGVDHEGVVSQLDPCVRVCLSQPCEREVEAHLG